MQEAGADARVYHAKMCASLKTQASPCLEKRSHRFLQVFSAAAFSCVPFFAVCFQTASLWLEGKLAVVCTLTTGLGGDRRDTRFVCRFRCVVLMKRKHPDSRQRRPSCALKFSSPRWTLSGLQKLSSENALRNRRLLQADLQSAMRNSAGCALPCWSSVLAIGVDPLRRRRVASKTCYFLLLQRQRVKTSGSALSFASADCEGRCDNC